jgi:RND family efflux transporter MFP subunit
MRRSEHRPRATTLGYPQPMRDRPLWPLVWSRWLSISVGLVLLADIAIGAPDYGPRATGVVVPDRSVEIAAKLVGRIVEVHADLGERVADGALLVELDAAELSAQRAAAAAELASTQLEKAWRERAADRLERLAEAQSLSQDRLDDARYDLATAVQRVRLAEANLARIDAALSETRLTAPFAGVVVARDAEIGQLTQPGAALLRLEDHSRLKLHARVNEMDLRRLRAGELRRR